MTSEGNTTPALEKSQEFRIAVLVYSKIRTIATSAELIIYNGPMIL